MTASSMQSSPSTNPNTTTPTNTLPIALVKKDDTEAASLAKPGRRCMNPWTFLRKYTTLTHWIFVGMGLGLLLGGLLGPSCANTGRILSNIFLRSVSALISPLIFSTLVVGIAGHSGDAAKVGRMFLKSIIYFEVVTTLALFIGLLAANILQPGVGVTLGNEQLDDKYKKDAEKLTLEHELEKLFPESFYKAAANNDTLSIVVCAIVFSIALLWVKSEHRRTMVHWMHSLSEVMFQVTYIVMLLAPIGIMGALMKVIGQSGFGVLVNLGKLVGVLYLALVCFVFLVLVPVLLVFQIPVREFVTTIYKPALLAFTTASSESALPMAMERMHEFGVPKPIVAFVMPTGYSFNLDGTTLHLAIASRFAAQAAGKEQSLGEQLLMMLSLMLVSKGVAAVPRASIVILTSTCKSFGLPYEAIAMILGVDTFMDMARTSINLVGNCIATIVVARWEGQFRVPDVPLDVDDQGNNDGHLALLPI